MIRPTLVAPLLLTACIGQLDPSTATENRPGVETRVVELCTDGDATEGFASFVLRDVDGNTISAEDTTIEQTIDGSSPGSGKWEGGQSLDETNLSSDIHVTLVLDASKSIAESALFPNMKMAAMDLLGQGQTEWETRPGEFTWSLFWFNQWVSEADDDWLLEDIEHIPGPNDDDDGFTRMYAALEFAVLEADRLRTEDGLAGDDRDNHLVVIFTDGRDNISGLPSPDPSQPMGVTKTGAGYTTHATAATTSSDVLRLLRRRSDWLQVAVLALGDDVDRQELEEIATAGSGSLFEANNVGVLFERAQRSFETVQTVGWRLPFNPGTTHRWRMDFTVDGLSKSTTIKEKVERRGNTPECEEPAPTNLDAAR
ncbi:MAG: VWA domain-containing protein [Myxococcales bacterium]|nr:VWA domain-containing protein [Myxococcales bacterium]